MFPEKEEILDRLNVEVHSLHKIQGLLQDGAPCTCLLDELNAVKKALTSIKFDLVKYQMKTSLVVINHDPDIDTRMNELKKIIELLNATADF